MRMRRCLPTLRQGICPCSRSLIRNGRETFRTDAASIVESSATGLMSAADLIEKVCWVRVLGDFPYQMGDNAMDV